MISRNKVFLKDEGAIAFNSQLHNNNNHDSYSLIQPGVAVGLVLVEALFEPQSDLSIGGLHRVGAVADVTSHIQREVTSDGA